MKKLQPLDFSGGVNLLRDIRYVGETELTYAKNFVPTKAGMVGKRLPRGLVNGSNSLPLGMGFPHTLALHVLDIPGVDFAAFYRTTATPRIAGVQVFNYASSSALATATYSILPKRRPSLVNFGRKSYAVAGYETFNQINLAGGVGASGIIIQEVPIGGGTEIVSLTFAAAQAIPVGPRLLASYHSRMVYADFGLLMEDWLIFSDRNAPTTISTDVLSSNGRNFRLGGTPGRITALREMMLTSTGTPTQTVLVAFKERAMYFITGEPGLTTDTATTPGGDPRTILGNLEVQRVNTDAGCCSAETVVQTPYGMLWAGPDDVWLMQEGSVPRRVGTKIRPILEATQADKRYLWHATYFNGFYRLSLFSDGQGPGEDSPCGEQWWLDLRDGVGESPRWWGPMVYKSVPGVSITDATIPWQSAHVYFVNDRVINGQNVYLVTTGGFSGAFPGPTGTGAGIIDGSVIWTWFSANAELSGIRMQAVDTRDGRASTLLSAELNNLGSSYLHNYDVSGYSGRDGVAESGFSGAVSPATLDDTEITMELRTAELDDGDPGTVKTYQGTEVSLASSDSFWFWVESQFNGGARVITNNEIIQAASSFVLDVSTLDSASTFTREFKAHTIRPDEGTRPSGITIRQRIFDIPGYIIDETNDTLGFIVDGSPGLPMFAFRVSIPRGWYREFGYLVDAISAAFSPGFLASTPTPMTNAFLIHNHNPFLGPRTSATLQLTIDPNASFTLVKWGLMWTTDLTYLVIDPVAQKLAATMGFDVTATDPISGVVGTALSTITNLLAASFVFNRRAVHFELNNIIHDSRPFGRRPL